MRPDQQKYWAWTEVLAVFIGSVLPSAFPAILVCTQDLTLPPQAR